MSVLDYFFKTPLMELYEFVCGSSAWRYAATSEREIAWDGRTFSPEYVDRSALHFSSDFAKDRLSVTLPATAGIAAAFLSGTPDFRPSLTIYRGSLGGSYEPAWKGLVTGAAFAFSEGEYSCELSCETAMSLMERTGLFRKYELSCPHTLYSAPCGVAQALFAVQARVEAAGGFMLTVPTGKPDGWFSGGQIVLSSGERRYISSSSGSILRLEHLLPHAEGKIATLYPGCDKSRATCQGKFGNGINFGGFPWMPEASPFTSTIG